MRESGGSGSMRRKQAEFGLRLPIHMVCGIESYESQLARYLDTAGMKGSRAYVINGVVIFFSWLVARILLFMYLFYHVYLHYNEVKQMHAYGLLLVFVVPLLLSVMNFMWFWKIFKGLKQTLAKRQ